jgi:hypothetical protein
VVSVQGNLSTTVSIHRIAQRIGLSPRLRERLGPTFSIAMIHALTTIEQHDRDMVGLSI